MSPRPNVSEERKNQILEAATAVFARLGLHQSRMDDIASQAGLSKGALYLYYKSKDAIVVALLKHFFNQEISLLQEFVKNDSQEPIAEQLLLLTRQLVAAIDWMSEFITIAFEFYALAGRDKEVRQFLQDYYKVYRSELARLIQRGVERGEFHAVDTEATAATLVAQYEGLALLYFLDPQALRLSEQAETAVRLFISGLRQTGTL